MTAAFQIGLMALALLALCSDPVKEAIEMQPGEEFLIQYLKNGELPYKGPHAVQNAKYMLDASALKYRLDAKANSQLRSNLTDAVTHGSDEGLVQRAAQIIGRTGAADIEQLINSFNNYKNISTKACIVESAGYYGNMLIERRYAISGGKIYLILNGGFSKPLVEDFLKEVATDARMDMTLRGNALRSLQFFRTDSVKRVAKECINVEKLKADCLQLLCRFWHEDMDIPSIVINEAKIEKTVGFRRRLCLILSEIDDEKTIPTLIEFVGEGDIAIWKVAESRLERISGEKRGVDQLKERSDFWKELYRKKRNLFVIKGESRSNVARAAGIYKVK